MTDGTDAPSKRRSRPSTAADSGRRKPRLKLSRRAYWALALLIVAVATRGRILTPVWRGWTASEELLQKDKDYRQLVAGNDAIEDWLRFASTPQGKDAVAREKLGLIAPDEVLINPVVKTSVAPPRPLTPQERFRQRVGEARQDAATWVHHVSAVLDRWVVDPPGACPDKSHKKAGANKKVQVAANH
jgi:hypothetical protein